MTTNSLDNGNTGTPENVSQDGQSDVKPSKTYTQEEFDRHMSGLKQSLTKKLLKPYEDLGDIEELRQLRSEAERVKQENALKRGEFETILKDSIAKKDAEIAKRDAVIQGYKIDVPLVNAAAKFRAVNAEQVKQLLKSYTRLNAEGEVEVVSTDGKVRYNSDNGNALTVDDLVKEFLDLNPHFIAATPTTANTKSSVSADNPGKIDITKLNMQNPEHREIYKKYRKANGITS